ncbi:hypothetical protein K4H28_10145 [Deefgea tanakiae]|uniref:Uncharacterized protein n=1 Tax=Deefgea tanakiae TaxID=2865840 RepID=A0ABX8Z6M2_9NEIS|nr:hypothetical protein [Deefgea tanakiae]QZA76688.1 hypothetical protein K4H28_10145 [Deefgea tanakiae]
MNSVTLLTRQAQSIEMKHAPAFFFSPHQLNTENYVGNTPNAFQILQSKFTNFKNINTKQANKSMEGMKNVGTYQKKHLLCFKNYILTYLLQAPKQEPTPGKCSKINQSNLFFLCIFLYQTCNNRNKNGV